MTSLGRAWATCLAVCAALFGFAFLAAPASCEWGLEAYTVAGLASIVALFGTPLLLRARSSSAASALIGLGFAASGIAVWLAGLFMANVRIICRLF